LEGINSWEGIINILQNLQMTVNKAEAMLEKEKEWIKRYAEYASEILTIQNAIKGASGLFNECEPLYVYSSVSRATNKNITFDLRYRGQSVADIIYKNGELYLKTKKNTYNFYKIEGGWEKEWNSKEAKLFRSAFTKYPCRNDEGKKNEEHRFESALLTELSKEKGNDKILKYIQPVRLAKSRFQMPTPFKASKGKPVYAKHKGGGIDLLCRTKHGSKNILNIFELKDEYENPINVLHQAVIYSVFIHKLLKTPEVGSSGWWKLFGFGKVPDTTKPLRINAVVAMPKDEKNDKCFAKEEINVDGGIIQLHYFYFSLPTDKDKIESIETSLF